MEEGFCVFCGMLNGHRTDDGRFPLPCPSVDRGVNEFCILMDADTGELNEI